MTDTIVDRLVEVRAALQASLDEQKQSLDQLVQRASILLGAASVLAGLLAIPLTSQSLTGTRKSATILALALIFIALLAGVAAILPQARPATDLPFAQADAAPATIDSLAGHSVEEFLREECKRCREDLTGGFFASALSYRRFLFWTETLALTLGAIAVAASSLMAILKIS